VRVALGSSLAPAGTLALAACLAGCQAERLLRITSDPPRAEVRIDGQRYGVTPLEVPFDYYGRRRITLYLDGYHTWSSVIPIEPRWYGYFPVDIFSEVLIPVGWKDVHEIYVELEPGRGLMISLDVQAVLDHAQRLRRSGPEPKPTPADTPQP
jgi:hypothetical protein